MSLGAGPAAGTADRTSRGISALAPRALDRLGLLTLLLSLYFVQYWGAAISDEGRFADAKLAAIGLATLGVLVPRLHGLLLVHALAILGHYVVNGPMPSNNGFTALAVSLVVLGAALVDPRAALGGEAAARERFFETIATPGRWLLPTLYFWGIYHKINTGFLDPEVSCAVAVWRPLAAPFGLADWEAGHQAAIWGTFVAEGVGMAALFFGATKRLGMAVGLPFHIAIGLSGFAYFKNFSTITFVLYALHMPKEAPNRAVGFAARLAGSRERALSAGRAGLLLAVAAFWAGPGLGPDGLVLTPSHGRWLVPFAIVAALFYLFAVLSIPPGGGTRRTVPVARGHALLHAIPLLYLLNGASPYLGLKTEASMAMFSNLTTEGGRTNHLLHRDAEGRIAQPFGYQRELLEVVSMVGSHSIPDWLEPGARVVRWQLDRFRARHGDVVVTVRQGGETVTIGPGWRNTYLEASPLERWFLVFRTHDVREPRVCVH